MSNENKIEISNNCFDIHNKFRVVSGGYSKHALRRAKRKAVIDAGIRAGIFDINQNEQDPNISTYYEIIASQLIRAYEENKDLIAGYRVILENFLVKDNDNGLSTLYFSTNKCNEYLEEYEKCGCNPVNYNSHYNFNFDILNIQAINFSKNTTMLRGIPKSISELKGLRRWDLCGDFTYGNASYYRSIGAIPYYWTGHANNMQSLTFLDFNISSIEIQGLFKFGDELILEDNNIKFKCIDKFDEDFRFIENLEITHYENIIAIANIYIKTTLNKTITEFDITNSETAINKLRKTTKRTHTYF